MKLADQVSKTGQSCETKMGYAAAGGHIFRLKCMTSAKQKGYPNRTDSSSSGNTKRKPPPKGEGLLTFNTTTKTLTTIKQSYSIYSTILFS